MLLAEAEWECRWAGQCCSHQQFGVGPELLRWEGFCLQLAGLESDYSKVVSSRAGWREVDFLGTEPLVVEFLAAELLLVELRL